MLTAFVLGSTVAGGILVLGMLLVFRSLLSLRYLEARASPKGETEIRSPRVLVGSARTGPSGGTVRP